MKCAWISKRHMKRKEEKKGQKREKNKFITLLSFGKDLTFPRMWTQRFLGQNPREPWRGAEYLRWALQFDKKRAELAPPHNEDIKKHPLSVFAPANNYEDSKNYWQDEGQAGRGTSTFGVPYILKSGHEYGRPRGGKDPFGCCPESHQRSTSQQRAWAGLRPCVGAVVPLACCCAAAAAPVTVGRVLAAIV